MPWKATDELKERTKFVLEWERRWNEAEGCLSTLKKAAYCPPARRAMRLSVRVALTQD